MPSSSNRFRPSYYGYGPPPSGVRSYDDRRRDDAVDVDDFGRQRDARQLEHSARTRPRPDRAVPSSYSAYDPYEVQNRPPPRRSQTIRGQGRPPDHLYRPETQRWQHGLHDGGGRSNTRGEHDDTEPPRHHPYRHYYHRSARSYDESNDRKRSSFSERQQQAREVAWSDANQQENKRQRIDGKPNVVRSSAASSLARATTDAANDDNVVLPASCSLLHGQLDSFPAVEVTERLQTGSTCQPTLDTSSDVASVSGSPQSVKISMAAGAAIGSETNANMNSSPLLQEDKNVVTEMDSSNEGNSSGGDDKAGAQGDTTFFADNDDDNEELPVEDCGTQARLDTDTMMPAALEDSEEQQQDSDGDTSLFADNDDDEEELQVDDCDKQAHLHTDVMMPAAHEDNEEQQANDGDNALFADNGDDNEELQVDNCDTEAQNDTDTIMAALEDNEKEEDNDGDMSSNGGSNNGAAAAAAADTALPLLSTSTQHDDATNDSKSECPFFYHEDGKDPMAFCCANCQCDPERQAIYGSSVSQQWENDYYHRHCCHKIRQDAVDDTWLPPLQMVLDEIQKKKIQFLEGTAYPKPEPVVIGALEFNELVSTSRRDSEVKHNDELEAPVDLLSTNQQYVENQKKFANEVKERKKEKSNGPAVVLDMFAGIGAATVVLKRLGIAMSAVIHVEHDKVAEHVVRYRHDKTYNPELSDDGIKHTFLHNFEFVESNIDQFLQEYGPIDIIIGGPPCTDYSGVNANRRGTQGEQGQFLPRFCDLIRKIQAKQQNHPVYYLIENVVFADASRADNYDLIESKIGVETKQDALYLSPCKRHRSYWLNFPLGDCAGRYEEAAKIRPSSCLEEGWIFPGEEEAECGKASCVKANTFLASKTKINDKRMVKARPLGDGRYELGHFSALERERMLGFPDGYVKGAVEHLFRDELFTHALELRFPDKDKEKRLWKKDLDPKYFCFSGEEVRYEEAYDEEREEPWFVGILLSPPKVTRSRDFYNAEDYSRRLLGNSFTIPVVEYLLTRLQKVFARREYEGYEYNFCWKQKKAD